MSFRALMQRISVDFPDPDGPMIQTTSPFHHIKRDTFQHLKIAERLCGRPLMDTIGSSGVQVLVMVEFLFG